MSTLAEVKEKSKVVLNHPLLNSAVKYGAELLIEMAYESGVEFRYTHGYRSYSEQQALYNQGRTAASKARGESVVTNAKPGHSNHNYGLALDIVLTKSGYDMKADLDHDGIADWMEVVTLAKMLGFDWGGDWQSFKDNPHLEITFGLTIKQLLDGHRPTPAQVEAVISKMKAVREANDVIAKLEEKIATQESVIRDLSQRLAAIEKRLNISGKETYATNYQDAVVAAKAIGAITTVNDKSKLELNIIQMLYNMGLFNPEGGE